MDTDRIRYPGCNGLTTTRTPGCPAAVARPCSPGTPPSPPASAAPPGRSPAPTRSWTGCRTRTPQTSRWTRTWRRRGGSPSPNPRPTCHSVFFPDWLEGCWHHGSCSIHQLLSRERCSAS